MLYKNIYEKLHYSQVLHSYQCLINTFHGFQFEFTGKRIFGVYCWCFWWFENLTPTVESIKIGLRRVNKTALNYYCSE